MTEHAKNAGKIILDKQPGFRAKLGFILGSGLGAFAEKIDNAIVIPYSELPGFPIASVAGHSGNIIIGDIHGTSVACLQGRAHYYEGYDNETIKTLIRTLKVLGCDTMIATNAAGSLNPAARPGDLVVVNDHMNFQGRSPLAGPNDDDFGPRFPGMDEAYDSKLREQLHSAGERIGITMTEGVYVGLLGPQFETPAEIRAYRSLGADLVGMSTVPDVIIARHCDMRVAAVSVVTNMAAGMSDENLTHEGTLENAAAASEQLITLLLDFVAHHNG